MDFFEHQDRARHRTIWLVVYFIVAVIAIVLTINLTIVGILRVAGVFDEPVRATRSAYPTRVPSQFPPGYEYEFDARKTGRPARPPAVVAEPVATPRRATWWQPQIYGWVTLGTLAVIILGSLYKIMALSGGGRVVAEMMGGRLVTAGGGDADEQRLQNIVEEMSIASGVPVPPVYVMEGEEGINAFAAGFTPQDAVIGITRGALQTLNRDEMQGVIAHEFSHILNGDMRLNLRLIGVLNGILVIAVIGYMILRIVIHSRPSSSSRSRGKGGGGILAVLAIGAALTAIGYIGVLFGRLIQAAVSRQREFLADASAVQFTRNPRGIAGALKKIGAMMAGSRIQSSHALETSHMFFASAMANGFMNLLSTHPPLDKRIRAIEPNFDGRFDPAAEEIRQAKARSVSRPPGIPPIGFPLPIPGMPGSTMPGNATVEQLGPESWRVSSRSMTTHKVPLTPEAAAALAQNLAAMSAGGQTASAGLPIPLAGLGTAIAAEQITAQVGHSLPRHVAFAAEFLATVPPALTALAREPLDACAIVLGMVLSSEPDARKKQTDYLNTSADPAVARQVPRVEPALAGIGPGSRIPLLNLAAGGLRQLARGQAEQLVRDAKALIDADGRVTLFEYALFRIIRHYVAAGADRKAVHYYALKPLMDDAAVLLSALARIGAKTDDGAAAAFASGVAMLGVQALPMPAAVSWPALDASLDRFAMAAPGLKRRVLEAAAHCVAADGMVQLEEGELLRAVSIILDCPLPPLLADLGQ